MSFSDWITIVSIFFGVLLAFFKYSEWQVIRLKKPLRLVFIPLILTCFSGICSYFNTNGHPNGFNWFWQLGECFPSEALWAIIWLLGAIAITIYNWKTFVHQNPCEELLDMYYDLLRTSNTGLFSSLFYKYEKGFVDGYMMREYEFFTREPLFWKTFPSTLERKLLPLLTDEKSKAALLKFQLSALPNCSLDKELKLQYNGINLTKDTPILNSFLEDKNSLIDCRGRDKFLGIVRNYADDYFNSPSFQEHIHLLSLKRDWLSPDKFNPFDLPIFYCITLIEAYWMQVIFTKNNRVSSFFFYEHWATKLLEAAPDIESSNNSEKNLYTIAVEQMIDVFGICISELNEPGYENMSKLSVGLINDLLRFKQNLKDNFPNKIPTCFYDPKPH